MRMTLLWVLLFVTLLFLGCSGNSQDRVTVFAASSLAAPIETLSQRFQEGTGSRIAREYSGSHLAIRKVEELGRQADMVISADPDLIRSYMFGNSTEWFIEFLGGSMVLAYTESSLFSSEINADNWPEILRREKVSTGITRTDVEPAGYRVVISLGLAERHYNSPGLSMGILNSIPMANVKHDVAALVAPLQAHVFDYIFTYRSLAVQHRLKFIALPNEVDLSSRELDSLYSRAGCDIAIPGREKVHVLGKAITYGLVITSTGARRENVREFLGFLLDTANREIWESQGQDVLKQPRIVVSPGGRIPQWLDEMAGKHGMAVFRDRGAEDKSVN